MSAIDLVRSPLTGSERVIIPAGGDDYAEAISLNGKFDARLVRDEPSRIEHWDEYPTFAEAKIAALLLSERAQIQGPDREEEPEDDQPYTADEIALERAAIIAKYAIGSPCTGFASYAKHGDFVVTRAEIGFDKPRWWKGRKFEATWDRLRSEGWSHDSAPLPLDYSNEDDIREEWVFFEFRLPAAIVAPPQLDLFGAVA